MSAVSKQHRFAILFFVGITILILGPMLAPGYVLTLDMVWPTELTVTWNHVGFNNALPLQTLLATLGVVLPSWVVQKCVLVVLFFLLLYLPYRFLPYISAHSGRIFAGLVYTLNPFVYTRLLAGQWTVLLGYALLPIVLYGLVRLVDKTDKRSAFVFAGTLLFVGAVSIHFLYISVLLALIWLGVHFGSLLMQREWDNARTLALHTLLSAGVVFMVSLYWLVPALLRTAPIEVRFDAAHFEAFAASSNELIPAPLNVLALGGFWAEDMEWRYQFVWPQDSVLFWMAAVLIALLILYGAYRLLRDPKTRPSGLLIVELGIMAYILALGAWGGVFTSLNLWLYTNLPGWSGLRDSHKIAGLLALLYTLCAGVGVGYLNSRMRSTVPRLAHVLGPALFLLPLCFGIYQWGGFHGQLTPVWYPDSWYEAQDILDDIPEGEKVLVLPWRGYFSLPFAEQRITSNPTPRFFGANRMLTSRTVEVGAVYDQEVDAAYRTLDTFVTHAHTLSTDSLALEYATHNIRYLLVIRNAAVGDDEKWYIPSETDNASELVGIPLGHDAIATFLRAPHTTLIESDIALYRFE